jgi:hypothetical protein|tara:strand:- start:896 stop:1477 length:582 start_codon:yes stop_codon:yes gene_type:complete
MKLREITQVRENPLAQQQAPATKAAGAVKQVAQKVGQGAKMAAQKMGGKGTGGMMAKGLDKLASGGALTGNLSKQIAPFAKQLSTILADTTLRNKFMMLVKQAEAGAKKQAAQQPAQQQAVTQSMDVEEAATPGATSAGAIATVANPITAYAKVKKDGKGVPKADQKKTPKGTAVNALDMKGASLFGGNIQKR